MKKIAKFFLNFLKIALFIVAVIGVIMAFKPSTPPEVVALQKVYCVDFGCEPEDVRFEERPDGSIWAYQVDNGFFKNIIRDEKVLEEGHILVLQEYVD